MPKPSDKDKGPKPVEIAVAAVLSLIVGVIGAVAFLALQAPERVSEMPEPEDRELGRLYYVEEKAGGASHDTWQPKETAVQVGRSGRMTLVEEELNRWAAAKEFERDDNGDGGFLTLVPGTPRFRIADGEMTIRAPLRWSVFGASRTFDGLTSGNFVQSGGTYAFDHGRVYVGSCPVPGFLGNRLFRDVVASYAVSDELRTGWAGLERVELEDESLRLVIP